MTPLSALLCSYKYDPLDRLMVLSRIARLDTQRFYNKNHLTTEIEGSVKHSLFQNSGLALAQSRHENGIREIAIFASDSACSVLQIIGSGMHKPFNYTVYGHLPENYSSLAVPGFNGKRADSITGHYLLGNGYRAFNPALMRFNSPDNYSPFGEGGTNSYSYCKGDPVNFDDPTGHFLNSLRKSVVSSFGNSLRKSQLSVSLDFTNGAVDGVSKYQNIRRIAGGLYVADEPIAQGGKSLIINGHGREGGHLLSKNRIMEPRDVVSRLKRKGVTISDYTEVHLMICHSAEGGNTSLAKYLNGKFGIPITAYEGSVGTFYSPASIAKNEAKKVPWLYRSSLKIREATFLKSKQMDIRNSGSTYTSPSTGVTHILNYRPIRIE